MGLHDGIGDEGSKHLLSSKPPTIKAIHRLLRTVDAFELDINLALMRIKNC